MDISVTTVRMFVHVLAATVWVGGQIVMLGLLPAARELGPEAPRALARRFGRVSWPALAVLTFTGIWNALSVDFMDMPNSYKAKFGLKMACYVLSALGAAAHVAGPALGRTRPKLRVPLLAIGGTVGAFGAFGALFFAVALRY